VIINCISKDLQNFSNLCSNEYLKQKAGDEIVQIEQKGPQGNYGTSLKRSTMSFGGFLQKLETGTDNLYLTTQYNEELHNTEEEENDNDEIQLSSLCPVPINKLIGDFPLVPEFLCNLIPNQIY